MTFFLEFVLPSALANDSSSIPGSFLTAGTVDRIGLFTVLIFMFTTTINVAEIICLDSVIKLIQKYSILEHESSLLCSKQTAGETLQRQPNLIHTLIPTDFIFLFN
jgi:hypothetical protein